MLTKFIEGLGGKLAEQWVPALLTPAVIFWASGLGIWIYRHGWVESVKRFTVLPPPMKIILPAASLVGVAISALVIQRLEAPVLRLLEGYWPRWRPLNWLRHKLIKSKTDHINSMNDKWAALKAREAFQLLARTPFAAPPLQPTSPPSPPLASPQLALPPLTSEEMDQLQDLEWKLHHVPIRPAQPMPTKLGNVLRSAERRPANKYGLDVIVCWPRLWMLLPVEVKKDLTDARADLNAGVRVFLWALLFLFWSTVAGTELLSAIIVGLSGAAMAFSYFNMMIGAAEIYGSLLEATFDLYRPVL